MLWSSRSRTPETTTRTLTNFNLLSLQDLLVQQGPVESFLGGHQVLPQAGDLALQLLYHLLAEITVTHNHLLAEIMITQNCPQLKSQSNRIIFWLISKPHSHLSAEITVTYNHLLAEITVIQNHLLAEISHAESPFG